MSFIGDSKRKHSAAADAALQEQDLQRAAFHFAKAAEYALKLAEQTEGKVSRSYVAEARELVELAEDLKAKTNPVSKGAAPAARSKTSDVGEGSDGEEDWLVTEKPAVRLTDIAGMEDVKTKLAEMVVEPLRHPEKAKEWGVTAGGGILLFGPPGNGKTTLGKAVAGELEADFFYATGAEIRSKWHGESEQRLRKLIQAARSRPVSVLFLDDVDGLLPRRGGNSVVDNRMVVQFLNEIGGFAVSPNVLLLLGATNNPWDIDEAVFRTGRFDEKIFVGLPDQAAREFIIQKSLGETPRESLVNPLTLAAKLDGCVGSDIEAVVQSAKRAGFRRSITGGSNLLTLADVEQAMKTIPSSATPQMMKEYQKFALARFR